MSLAQYELPFVQMIVLLFFPLPLVFGFPWWLRGLKKKNLPAMQETQVVSLSGEEPLESGNGYPLQYSGEFLRQRSLAGCIPWGHKESDTPGRLTLSPVSV